MSKPDALPVIIERVWDEDYEEHVWQLQCPHCERVGQFREVEVAERWGTTDEFRVVDGKILQVTWSLGTGDYEHDRYECQCCDNPVTMEIEQSNYQI